MKTKMRPRYYCDYCPRASGNPATIKRHEAGCTLNPERSCGFCRRAGKRQAPMERLVWAIDPDGGDPKRALDRLRAAAADCPACTLAAIRQWARQTETFLGEPIEPRPDPDSPEGRRVAVVESLLKFRFADAAKDFWQARNEEAAAAEAQAYPY